MSLTLKLYVPLSDVREDTISPRYHQLGYAVVNDPKQSSTEEGPVMLTDRALLKRPFANLTLGYFSGQAHGSPHVSRLDYSMLTDTGLTWNETITAWCKQEGVSNDKRPTTSQLVRMLETFNVPFSYGMDMVRNIADRLVAFIMRIHDTSVVKSAKQLGKTTIINNLMFHLVDAGVFEQAIRSVAKPTIISHIQRKQSLPSTVQEALPSPPPSPNQAAARHSRPSTTVPGSGGSSPTVNTPPRTPIADQATRNRLRPAPVSMSVGSSPTVTPSPRTPNDHVSSSSTSMPFSPSRLVGQNVIYNVLSKHTHMLDILQTQSKNERAHIRQSLNEHSSQLGRQTQYVGEMAQILLAYRKAGLLNVGPGVQQAQI
ncbi:hypothetical protein Slin15195_G130180 [Septoria linicola]|uniref:Uncharacterized protein n=1 Tax=Septoria linicola TaxID=215465 RepID=A0A9Q9ERA7_9PEZI|nr:hypothetical protein Slin14017_G122070 [Septoria linicola]USW59699.1 hypothetical protein Slin15195_G130180 [Septoria linicola]